jgi:hypothetical protein
MGAALKLPLPPGAVKAVKAAVKAAAAPPMGTPVPLEYAFDGLLQHVPAPGTLVQWCANAITGAGWLVSVSPGTIWNCMQVLRRLLGLPLAAGGRFAGRGGVWWRGGRPVGGAPLPPGAPAKIKAKAGMLGPEQGKADFAIFADVPGREPAGAASGSDAGSDSGGSLSEEAKSVELSAMDDFAWDARWDADDASDEEGDSARAAAELEGMIGGQVVTVQQAREAREAAGGSLWGAACIVYHSTFLATLRQLGFHGAEVEGSLGLVVRRRSLQRCGKMMLPARLKRKQSLQCLRADALTS